MQQAREHSTGSHKDTARMHSTPAALNTELKPDHKGMSREPNEGCSTSEQTGHFKRDQGKREDGGTCPNWEEPTTMWVNVTQRRIPEETLMT